ncbi:uncharacterized protein LOC122263127 isoform X2 [Penaeus japonicus]|uniref:uncharacterized protein LOC122263127 isoform X2 n=1 Tax=Penaeus japonicus TaxID=27405 RepID=UPI001C715633|nr:uncharacterized protein LOC122263127 isoform X2 [Penaeus japonicus]
MAGNNIPVFNDLLCFFVGKLRVFPRLTLTDAIAQFYNSDEVKLAYDILQDCLSRCNNQENAEITDREGINFDCKPDVVGRMYDILSQTSVNDMPFFVCRDVNNLPSCRSDDAGSALQAVARMDLNSSPPYEADSEAQRGTHEGRLGMQAVAARSLDVVEQIFSEVDVDSSLMKEEKARLRSRRQDSPRASPVVTNPDLGTLEALRQELSATYSSYTKVDLASGMISQDTCDVDKIYFEIMMEQEDPPSGKRVGRKTFLRSALSGNLPRVVVLNGESGSGKTVLYKKLIDEWTSGGGEGSAMADFDLVFKAECHEKTRSLKQLLAKLLPVAMHDKGDAQLRRYILSRRILFLVDGIEELNENSDALLEEILSLASRNVRIVCSTRPFRLNRIRRKVMDAGLCFMVVRMVGVPPVSRTAFIVKYLENLVSPHRNKEYREWLYVYFRNIGNWCKKTFTSPFNLAILTLLTIYNPAMMNHLTTGTAFFAQVEKFRILRLVNHLAGRPEYANSPAEELKFLCSGFTKLLNQLAFESLQLGETSLSLGAMTKLDDKCRHLGLPAAVMFSAFLKCQLSTGNRSYSFEEKSIQEFRAACHMCYLATYQPALPSDSSQSCQGAPFYDVVFFTAGLLAEKLSHAFSENTEFIIQQAVGAGMKETSEWLDLLQEAQCHEVLAEAVGRTVLRKDKWDVKEVHLPALKTLLHVATPESLCITVDSLEKPPEDIPVLSEVLKLVAVKPISVSLNLNYYFVMGRSRNADNLLRLLLQNSKCIAVIKGFLGYLSSSMISQLPKTLHTLALQADSQELRTLASILPAMKHLETLGGAYFPIRFSCGRTTAKRICHLWTSTIAH